jgi:UDP-galactose transporter B1
VLNTVQSLLAAVVGYVYLYVSTLSQPGLPAVLPRGHGAAVLPPLALVAATASLASPFGYASLRHVDYITYILAKSCKLVPVMALHLTVFRRRYPLYKYAVVALVTAGVAIFTLHHPPDALGGGKHSTKPASTAAATNPSSASSTSPVSSPPPPLEGKGGGSTRSPAWGLFLLAVNLLFDGLTNSTQDYIFQTFQPFSGPQMMCALNALNTLLTGAYLLAAPALARTRAARLVGLDAVLRAAGATRELRDALAFVRRHRAVVRDILGFAACGAVGQLFICMFLFLFFVKFFHTQS